MPKQKKRQSGSSASRSAGGAKRLQSKRKKSSKKGRRKVKRPYGKHNKAARLKARYRRARHVDHGPRMLKEAESLNYLLHQLLKTASSTEDKPYNYEPRHYTKDPEYAFSSPALQEFKRGVPAPDTHHWRPQGQGMPPHRGNY